LGAGDPVNVVTGSFDMKSVDLIMEDIGVTLEIKRIYNSKDTSIGSMGRSWSFNFETKLEIEKEEIKLICEDGHVETFNKTEDKWVNENPNNEAWLLSKEKFSDVYLLKTRDKKEYYYHSNNGKLRYIKNRNNNKISLAYDEEGNIKTIKAPSERSFSFKYNEENKVAEIVDNAGRKISYSYEEDNLVQVELPNKGIIEYTYKDNLVVAVEDQASHLYVKNEYDHKKRIVRQYDNEENIIDIEYDDKNKENTFIKHARGTKIKYKYNGKNLVTEIIYEDGTKESCTYDEAGNKNSETDRNGNITKRVFDKRGNILEEIYSDGYSIKNQYNDNGYLISSNSSGGGEILYSYDDRGNLLEKAVKIGIGYSRTKYTYDRYGRMLTKADGVGNTTTFGYGKEIDKATEVVDPEGNRFSYTYSKSTVMTSIKTDYGEVEFGYNNLNKRTSIKDAKGNTTNLMYDKMGNLVKKTTPNQNAINNYEVIGYRYKYDFMDRLIETVDPLDNVYEVKYDAEGNVIKEINPNYMDRGIGDGIGVEYEYDEANRRTKIKYPTGGTKRIKYDRAGNITKIIEAVNYKAETDEGPGKTYEYDNRNRLVIVRDAEGKVERKFIYDIEGRVVKEINARGYLSGDSDEERFGTLYKYNLAGWMTEKRVPVERKQNEILYNVTVYKYDKAGNRTEEKRSPEYVGKEENPKEWNTISYKYDKNNRVVEISDSTGAEIKYSYDCLGNRKYESKKINSNTYNVKRYFYDSVGLLYRVKEEIAELKIDRYHKTPGAETYYEYDPNGNITKVVTPEGYESQIHYDAVDRITEIIKTNPEDKAFKRITTYEYDKAGNIIKETDCNGNSISYEYDAMNRQTKITDKEGGVTRIYYDASGNIIKQVTPENYNLEDDNGKGTSYNYDSMNRLVEVTNALGVIVQRNKYNEVGELIGKEDASKTGVEYSYDIGGRIKNIVTPGAKEKCVVSQEYCYDALGNVMGIVDGEGNKTSYKLDNWGKIKEVEKADGSREWYDYDYAGNVVSTMDGNGNKTEYSYNSVNLLAEIRDAAGDSMIYQYDKQGRLARQTDRNKNIIEYVYNQDDRVISRKDVKTGTAEFYNYNVDGSLASAAVNGQVYNYTYTANNRLKSKSVNGKTVLEYGYDKGGKVTELVDVVGRKTSYRYDIIGRMEEVWDGSTRSAAYTYNPDNTIAEVRYGNGVDVNYGYDLDKNIAGILGKNREGKDLLNHSYCYDSNGNQVRKDEEGAVTSYAYDSLNRLGEVVYPNNTIETFGYDNVGNRVERSLNSEVTSYAYDSRNRLTSLNVGENLTSFKYDNQGNLLSETSKEGTKAYTYDCFNRTSSVTNFDGSYIKNAYDPEGLRSEINEDGVISRFVFDRGSVVAELDSDENLKIATIRGLDIVSQVDSENNTYYYLNNYHGDVLGLTDEVGNVVNSYKYDAFGNTIEAKEQVDNRFRYSGEQYDSVTKQYYLRARFYNPVVGRFTQEDEYRGDGLNLYAYVGNNPINYVDPSGYSCKDSASKENVFEENNGPGGSNDEEAGAAEPVKNWRGEQVKIPEGHIMSPRDPSISAPPIYIEGPFTGEQREAFLKGESGGTKLSPHHRHQLPVRDGGVIDELPGPGHPEGNIHTKGSPSRHPGKSIFNSEANGNILRQSEINSHWKGKGGRLIEKEPGKWYDPGPED